ncbi:DUF4386 domain-containing protein [Candidatus Bipolaricaulota bacterium]
MNASRTNARWAGVFYIIATVAPILTVAFIGFLGGGVTGEPIPEYLAKVASNEGQVIIGMFVEVIWALAVVFIPIALFSILKKHNETLALGFLGLRFIEAISTIIHSILLLSLLTLSREYVAAGMPDASYFQTAGSLFLAGREWTFMIGSGLVWSLSALILNVLLYRTTLIPRWLSVWGLLGAALSLAAYLVQFFGIDLSEWMFLPIAVQEMVFAVWLIVKGLQPPAIASESAT